LRETIPRDVARREEGQREGNDSACQRAGESHDDGLQQLGPHIAVLPLAVVPEVVEGERKIGRAGLELRSGNDKRSHLAR
jgi:hypothetical protein